MRKRFNNYSCCCVHFIFMLCMVFLVKKKELSIMNVQIFSDSYTYTKKEQIEEVLKK